MPRLPEPFDSKQAQYHIIRSKHPVNQWFGMGTTSPHVRGFRWQWIAAGFMADVVGLMIVPAYNWTAHPVETWLSLIFFPYGMMSGLSPLLKGPAAFLWLAPLPLYGILLATMTGRRHIRIGCYCLAALHTVAAGIATIKYFRL